MPDFKQVISSITVATLMGSSLPAAELPVDQNSKLFRDSLPRRTLAVNQEQDSMGQIIKSAEQDDPKTRGYFEPKALEDLRKIRNGAEVLPGEGSQAVTFLQAKARALGLSGKFDDATQQVVKISLGLINRSLPEEAKISTEPLRLNLKTLAPLIQQEELLQKVAIASELTNGKHRIIEYRPTEALDTVVFKELNEVIKGVNREIPMLRSDLLDLRDNISVLRPGDSSPAISLLKQKLGIPDNSPEYTKELHLLVISAQVLHNHGSLQDPIHNDGTIDAKTFLVLLDSAVKGTGGMRSVSQIDILKSTLNAIYDTVPRNQMN